MSSRQRPMGQVEAEIYRPLLRFGSALHIGIIGYDGINYSAVGVENGNLLWAPRELGTEPVPIMYLDDDVSQAVARALEGTLPTDFKAAHLEDTQRVRDRMITLVEHLCVSPVIPFGYHAELPKDHNE